MPKPNFYIVGSPKCGTTSLYFWLKDHPEVFLPKTKEPHYFAELWPFRRTERLEDYLALFDAANERRHKAIGEASTTYLQTPGALENLQRFDPDAKIIITVRNPIEMAQSMHDHLVFLQTEDVTDFEQAWKLSSERAEGRHWPRTIKKPDPFQFVYTEMGLLGKHVQRALSLFPREQVHIIVFDDIKRMPRQVYLDLLDFLGIKDDGREEFEVKKASRTHSGLTAFITRFVTGLPQPVYRALRRIGIENTGIVDRTVERLAPVATRAPLSPEFRSEMEEFYRKDVELLGKLTGRDLSHWVSAGNRKPVAADRL